MAVILKIFTALMTAYGLLVSQCEVKPLQDPKPRQVPGKVEKNWAWCNIKDKDKMNISLAALRDCKKIDQAVKQELKTKAHVLSVGEKLICTVDNNDKVIVIDYYPERLRRSCEYLHIFVGEKGLIIGSTYHIVRRVDSECRDAQKKAKEDRERPKLTIDPSSLHKVRGKNIKTILRNAACRECNTFMALIQGQGIDHRVSRDDGYLRLKDHATRELKGFIYVYSRNPVLYLMFKKGNNGWALQQTTSMPRVL